LSQAADASSDGRVFGETGMRSKEPTGTKFVQSKANDGDERGLRSRCVVLATWDSPSNHNPPGAVLALIAAVAAMTFPVTIHTRNGSRVIRNCEEAVRLIDQEVPAEIRNLPRWTFALELLVVAARSGKKRDVNTALRQLSQAASNEGW
jgi:hypothetical protein